MGEEELFKVYYHVVENEEVRYRVYFAYQAQPREAIMQIEKMFNQKLHIYDIFPNFENEIKSLDTPIAVITESGKDMYLPTKLEMEFVGCSTILFGLKEKTST
jgi:hypothetical protein